MSQYALDPLEHRLNPEPYCEWFVTEPTTRRVDLYLMPPADARCEANDVCRWSMVGKHLGLIADNHGDNAVVIATASKDEYRAIADSPGMKRRAAQWHANSPRYGSWQHYLEDVALARYIFDLAGWTETPEEAAIMEAIEAYGQRAPARLHIA